MSDEIPPEARAALDAFVETGTAAVQIGIEEHVPPDLLYHFTDATGAVGILKEKMFWASRATLLNDASEVRFGIEQTKMYLGERIEHEQSPRRKTFLELVLDFLGAEGLGAQQSPLSGMSAELQEESDAILDVQHFVVSFCADTEQSAQWLHYGRSGAGYALGFRPGELTPEGFSLVKVIYEAGERQALIDRAVRMMEESFLTFAFRGDSDRVARSGILAAHVCATMIKILAARVKNPVFRSEQEWRLVSVRSPRMTGETTFKCGYRIRESRIVPYLMVPSPRAVEVVLGQAVDLAHAREALRLLFDFEDINPHPKLIQTTVPVR